MRIAGTHQLPMLNYCIQIYTTPEYLLTKRALGFLIRSAIRVYACPLARNRTLHCTDSVQKYEVSYRLRGAKISAPEPGHPGVIGSISHAAASTRNKWKNTIL